MWHKRLFTVSGWPQLLLAGGLGMLTVAGFAPFYLAWVPWLSLAVLFAWLLQAASAAKAWRLTFSFAMGLYGLGIYWIYISLHTFGGMPWWFAGFCTACLCGFMALFPAGAAYLASKFAMQPAGNRQYLVRLLVGLPVFWALSDWVRSWIFTGFPWLTLGYSQVPLSPLAGYLPIFGVYGVSLITAMLAAILAYALQQAQSRRSAGFVVGLLLVIGQLLTSVPWTQPSHAPIQVALLQGNIDQSIKWSPSQVAATMQRYLALVRAADAPLIVLPETALPMLLDQVDPTYLAALTQHAQAQNGDVLFGVITQANGQYFNSAVSVGHAPSQVYSKSHLVPFGEFIPLKALFGWIYRDWLHMPLSDLARGQSTQPLQLAGQKIGVNICYEDVFGEEIARQLPQAELLVNLSNDAWYGQSFAANQHLQFSQARAIETGRMVLRSTNTGATAMIDVHGQLLAHAPHEAMRIVQGTAQSYRGTTPYVWWGNWAFLIICIASLAWLQRHSWHG